MTDCRLPGVFLVISGLVLLTSIIRFDWMMLSADVLSISVICLYSRRGLGVPHKLFVSINVLSLAYLLISILRFSINPSDILIRGVSYIWIIELFVLFAAVFIIAFLIVLLVDRCTDSKISLRWMLVFAIVFTVAFSAVYLFMLGFDLWYNGRPFGYEDIDRYGWEINVPLMVPSTCAITVVITFSVLGRLFLKGHTKESLVAEV